MDFFLNMLLSAIGGIEWFVVAYVICLIYFLYIKNAYLRSTFVYPFVFMIVTLYNPFLIVPVAEAIGLTSRFRRLFWLIPVNLVLAYAFTYICTFPLLKSKRPAGLKQSWRMVLRIIAAIILTFCCAAFTVVCGSSVNPHLRMPQNIYKTNNAILSIASIIDDDSKATHTKKSAIYADLQLMELRQYDASIQNFLRRKDLLGWELEINDEAHVQQVIQSNRPRRILSLTIRYGIQIDPDIFRSNAKRSKIKYIVTTADLQLNDYFAQAGYEQIGTADIFEIYRIDSK